MQEVEVSVVIPNYNGMAYLDGVLSSLECQTFRDFEVILIDDGSGDGSGEICRRYAQEDKRVRYVRRENGGLGKARNLGISFARGRYIAFVDSDDYIDARMLEVLYENITRSGADVASCGVYNVFQQKQTPQYDRAETFLAPAEEAELAARRVQGLDGEADAAGHGRGAGHAEQARPHGKSRDAARGRGERGGFCCAHFVGGLLSPRRCAAAFPLHLSGFCGA